MFDLSTPTPVTNGVKEVKTVEEVKVKQVKEMKGVEEQEEKRERNNNKKRAAEEEVPTERKKVRFSILHNLCSSFYWFIKKKNTLSQQYLHFKEL